MNKSCVRYPDISCTGYVEDYKSFIDPVRHDWNAFKEAFVAKISGTYE